MAAEYKNYLSEQKSQTLPSQVEICVSVFSDESVNLTYLELRFDDLDGFPGIYRYDSDHVLQKK